MHDAGSPRIEDLRPVPAAGRVFTLLSYVPMLWASLIVVQAFVLGQALLPPQGSLTLLQGFTVVILAALVMAVFMSLNGQAGFRYGVPYCIHVRAAFGRRGALLPEILRLAPALIWYGFGTWIAVLSVDGIVRTLTGFSPAGIAYVYFLLLQALQTWLALSGIRVMKWFNVGASVALVLIMGYMLMRVLEARSLEVAASWRSAGDWGLAFWSGVNATIGILVAVMASASDLTRYVEQRQRTLWWGHVLGFAPPLAFMMFFGFVAAVTTGVWDPIEALMQLSPGPFLMILMLTFILVAQFSTNLAVNILPPAFIFQEMFGVSWQGGVVIAGVLGTLTFPWLLLQSGESFVTFINYYTAFFGPLLGCMLAQAWLERDAMDVDGLYRDGAGGRYWYHGGINLAGVATTLVVGALAMVFFLEISWLVGMPLGYFSHLALSRLLYGSHATGYAH